MKRFRCNMNDLMAETAVCLYMQQTTQRPKYCFFLQNKIYFFNVFSHTNKQERVRQQQKRQRDISGSLGEVLFSALWLVYLILFAFKCASNAFLWIMKNVIWMRLIAFLRFLFICSFLICWPNKTGFNSSFFITRDTRVCVEVITCFLEDHMAKSCTSRKK